MKNNLFYVVARSRSVLVDGNLTIREVIEELYRRGEVLSLQKTFQLYGLTYISEKCFTSKYRSVFSLNNSKSMMDIKVKELNTYRDLLISTYAYKPQWWSLDMIGMGITVEHNTFPPAKGVVVGYQPDFNGNHKIAVMQSNGVVMWAPLSEWNECYDVEDNGVEMVLDDSVIDTVCEELN